MEVLPVELYMFFRE